MRSPPTKARDRVGLRDWVNQNAPVTTYNQDIPSPQREIDEFRFQDMKLREEANDHEDDFMLEDREASDHSTRESALTFQGQGTTRRE
jgi:hypothetical protein